MKENENEEPPVTEAELARVAELDAKATQGSWIPKHGGCATAVLDTFFSLPSGEVMHNGCVATQMWNWDADLIAEYRTITPRLARELAAARSAIKVAREFIEKSPHTFMCASRNYVGGPINSHCDCGRTAALAQLNTHTHE